MRCGNFANRTLKRLLIVTTDAVVIVGWLFLILVMIYLTFAAMGRR